MRRKRNKKLKENKKRSSTLIEEPAQNRSTTANVIVKGRNIDMSSWGTLFSILGGIIAIISIPALIITIYSYESEKSAYIESKPARVAIVQEINTTCSYLFAASKSVINPIRKNASQSVKYQDAKLYLGYYEYHLNKLDELTIKNNGAMDSRLMSLVSQFVENARVIQKMLTYFAEFQNPLLIEYDFVSEGPFLRMRKIESIVQSLRVDYPDVLSKDDSTKKYQTDRIEGLWTIIDKSEDRLCLNPEKYVWKADRIPRVFNTKNMQRLPIPPPGISAKTYLTYGYQ